MRKAIFCILFAMSFVIFAACGGVNEKGGVEDFEFFIRFGVFGQSSYDSATGVLIKTADTIERSPEDYKTVFILSSELRAEIYGIISDLNIENYPDEFEPYEYEGQTIASSPSRTIILTVGDKTVSCISISLGGSSENPKGDKFLQATDRITEIIENSE